MIVRKFLLYLIIWTFSESSYANMKEIKEFSISEVNDFWNKKIEYKKENNIDIWQNPKETWELKTGDCEDFAIAKYYDLIDLGVDKEKLSLLWVIMNNPIYINRKKESHIVLLYEKDNNQWVLDNYSSEIVPLSSRSDFLIKVAVLNHKGVNFLVKKSKHIEKKWNKIIKESDKNIAFIKNLENDN